jgi:MFS family permease
VSFAELAYFTANGLAVPRLAAGPLGADCFGIGLAVGSFSAAALALRPIAGRAADAHGRRPLLVGGAAAYGVVTAVLAFTDNLTLLIILRLLLGAAEAFFFVGVLASVADLAPPGRTGEALSFNSLTLYIGIAAGPLIGETLLGMGGFTLALLGAAGLALTAALLAALLPETATSGPSKQARREPARTSYPATIGPGLALFAGFSAIAGFYAFVTLHARGIGMEGSNVILLEFGAIVVACRILFARMPDRLPPMQLGTAALASTAAGLMAMAIVDSPAGLMAGAAVSAGHCVHDAGLLCAYLGCS